MLTAQADYAASCHALSATFMLRAGGRSLEGLRTPHAETGLLVLLKLDSVPLSNVPGRQRPSARASLRHL